MVHPPRADGAGDSTADADALDIEPQVAVDFQPEHRVATVTADHHGQRLDKVLVNMAGEFSRNHLQGLVEGGHARVDGRVATSASRKVLAGQVIDVELVPTQESRAFRPETLPLKVVFEDEHLIVVNKAAGMVVHPAAGNWSGTLLNALLAHHANAVNLPRAGIVHRLDKDTSGLMVVGKTLASVTALTRAIAAREVHREYQAIAHGETMEAGFRVETAVGRDPKVRTRMAVVTGGKPARTDVDVVARRDGFSALICILHTGRTHQIRVHLASRGHPLVSDVLYGGRIALGMTRQALHARRLAFRHPDSGQAISFECLGPEDFLQAWTRLLPLRAAKPA
jgi:23S rRNA pseudouridine1911/1915/1917 synthase